MQVHARRAVTDRERAVEAFGGGEGGVHGGLPPAEDAGTWSRKRGLRGGSA